jgi:hypothetical protein
VGSVGLCDFEQKLSGCLLKNGRFSGFINLLQGIVPPKLASN